MYTELKKNKKKKWILVGFVLLIFVSVISLYLISDRKRNYDAEESEASNEEVSEVEYEQKVKLLDEIGPKKSQYSPYVLHKEGWGSYLMYYCKMSPIDGVWSDRVNRRENWNSGKDGEWISQKVVIEGTIGQNDDLSCSPGVVIDDRGANSRWHMYYVTAKRGEDCKTYLYHAVSNSPGTDWNKKGLIDIDGLDWPQTCAMETPTAIIDRGKIVLYFAFDAGKVYRTESEDGHNFSEPQIIVLSDNYAAAGRIFKADDFYYYVYSKYSGNNQYMPSDSIYVSRSEDGINFSEGVLLMKSNGIGWDGDRMWSPQLFKSGDEWRVYYAGNKGDYEWFGANTAIGVRTYSNANWNGLFSEEVLDCPVNLSYECSDEKAYFTWDSIDGAEDYLLQIDKSSANGEDDWFNPDEGDLSLLTGGETSYEIELEPGEDYLWWGVKGVKEGEAKPYSGCLKKAEEVFTCGCVPDCEGKECGDNGCGDSCGSCGDDEICNEGLCVVNESNHHSAADINEDGEVTLEDYGLFVEDYLKYKEEGSLMQRSDLDNNGEVNLADYGLFLEYYLEDR